MNLTEFVSHDAPKTLFWLDGPTVIAKLALPQLISFIDELFVPNSKQQFVQAPIAFALKDPHHVRRVHVLDPVATLFLYNFVHCNSGIFKSHHPDEPKRRYGYHLRDKTPTSAIDEHRQFRERSLALRKDYKYTAKLDISNCFASLYHHDIVSFLKPYVGEESSNRMGTFLRQINGGRSISCFPQGYFPTKAIGNLYLSFIENSVEISCPVIIRYLDDIFLFSNSEPELEKNIHRLQSILSDRNLYLNPAKSAIGLANEVLRSRSPKTAMIRKSLLRKRATALNVGYDEAIDPENLHLSYEEFKYLTKLLDSRHVNEEDVELALALITEDEHHAETLAKLVFEQYPHLVKSLYSYLSSRAYGGNLLWSLIEKTVDNSYTQEFVLFWTAKIARNIFELDLDCAKVLFKIYEHPNATDVVKSAILEIESNDYGLLEKKEWVIRNAGSSLTAISAAVGLRQLELAKRNQLYKYSAGASSMMYQITQALKQQK